MTRDPLTRRHAYASRPAAGGETSSPRTPTRCCAIVAAASKTVREQGVQGLSVAAVLDRAQLTPARSTDISNRRLRRSFLEATRNEVLRLRTKMAAAATPDRPVAAWIEARTRPRFRREHRVGTAPGCLEAQATVSSSPELVSPAYNAILAADEQLQRGLELGRVLPPAMAAKSIHGVVWGHTQRQWAAGQWARTDVRKRALRFCPCADWEWCLKRSRGYCCEQCTRGFGLWAKAEPRGRRHSPGWRRKRWLPWPSWPSLARAADRTVGLNNDETVAAPNSAAPDAAGISRGQAVVTTTAAIATSSANLWVTANHGATWRVAAALVAVGLVLAGDRFRAFAVYQRYRPRRSRPHRLDAKRDGATPGPTAPATGAGPSPAPSSIVSTPDQDNKYIQALNDRGIASPIPTPPSRTARWCATILFEGSRCREHNRGV